VALQRADRRGAELDLRASTVFDRSLFRAGETVSMKHFVRVETSRGLAPVPADRLPTRVKIVHQGSGQEVVVPLAWAGAGRSALTTWSIPPAAKLGVYEVVLEREPPPAARARRRPGWRRSAPSRRAASIFRLPLVVRVRAEGTPQVAASGVAVDADGYFRRRDGVAPLRASALLKTRSPSFSGYDIQLRGGTRSNQAESEARSDDSERDANGRDGKLIADKVALTTDRNGVASFALKDLQKSTRR
jgi:hypothetical protein